MRSVLAFGTLAVLTITTATPSFADEQAPFDPAAQRHYESVMGEATKQTNEEAGRVLSDGSPNSRAVAGFSATNLQFTSEGGETSASVAFSIEIEGYQAPKKKDGYYSLGTTRLSVVGSVPIEKGGTEADLFKGDSFVSGSKLKLSLTRVTTKVGSGEGAGPYVAAAYQKCVTTQANKWASLQEDPSSAQSTADQFSGQFTDSLAWRGSNVNFAGQMEQAATRGDVGKFVATACRPGNQPGQPRNTGELVSSYGENPEEFRLRFIPKNAKLTFWGFDASMGRDDVSYLDRTAFKLEAKPRTTWEVAAYYGYINSDLTFSLRGRAVYGQSYKDQDEAEICRTVSIPAGDECIKGPDGEPLRQRTGLISVEARKLVTVREGTQIAFAPQVTYRIEDKNLGIEVPIYLAPDEGGKLTGGIKAVYNSKGDEFAVGLFVGVPFSIFYD